LNTPVPDHEIVKSSSPFYFEAGYAGWAKRPSRPFPPPFFSPPSGSFSDPLSTTNRSMDRRAKVNGEMIRGVTNGDDAMLVSENLIGTNDGVGQWATRERGHAPLWSRLILHFWALAVEQDKFGGDGPPDPVRYLEESYRMTQEALSEPNEWLGTTTSSLAQLHSIDEKPLLYVTQLGDCRIMVVRQSSRQVIFTTEEQWHYFDCPRQLGTNSPDTPRENATLSEVPLHEDDVVLAMSDGVTDNLWEEDITESVLTALSQWQEEQGQSRPQQQQKKDEEDVIIEEVGQQQQPEAAAAAGASSPSSSSSLAEAMRHVAQQVVLRARRIAEDPFAASPFMEKGVEEGLAIEGGKMDDISVVAAVVCRRPKG
jgi:serine/threonine protein phosphatase PrpC